MTLIFWVEWSAGWITITGYFSTQDISFPFWLAVFYQLARFVSVGIREEIVSRGYQIKNLAEGFAKISFISAQSAILFSLFISSVLFGVMHLLNPNATWISTFNIVGAGILLGMGYILTGELAIPIALHITWNFFQGNVFGFPGEWCGGWYQLFGGTAGRPRSVDRRRVWSRGGFGWAGRDYFGLCVDSVLCPLALWKSSFEGGINNA